MPNDRLEPVDAILQSPTDDGLDAVPVEIVPNADHLVLLADPVDTSDPLLDPQDSYTWAGTLEESYRSPADGCLSMRADAPFRPIMLYPVLVPNVRGMERALAAGVRDVAVFTAASEGVTSDTVIQKLIEETPSKEGELTRDERFKKIFTS